MRFIRFIFFIFMLIPDAFGQEKISGSTIYLYSDPDNVKIEIPELRLKTDKDTTVLELKSLSNGLYNITFRERGNRLKTTINILEPDTFLVYANFYTNEIIAIIQKEYMAYNQEHPVQPSRDYAEEGSEDDSLLTFYIVEEMPTFNGGDPSVEFRLYIQENLRYPPEAAEKGIEGRVITQFVVDTLGYVIEPVILAHAHPLLEKEAMRVIQSSPPWSPGKQRGKKVRVCFTFPIIYYLEDFK